MKKALILAYAVSPTRGSEYSVSWNYIIKMSETTNLTVLYGTSGDHLGDVDELEEYLKNNTLSNVKFIPILPNEKAEKLNRFNKKGIFVYSFYLAFNEWHKQVYQYAAKLVQEEQFDFVHYLTPISYREPGYLWKLDLPYIWGPIGGSYSVPIKLMRALPFSGKLKLGFRKIANFLQLKLKSSLREAFRNTDVIIAATTYDQEILSKQFKKKIYYLPENGIIQNKDSSEKDYFTETFNLIWIGGVDERKALIILLESLKKISRKNIHLDVVGDGVLKEKLMGFANMNNINSIITWHGAVPRTEVMTLLENSHLHIISSLTEANTTVIWEAMTNQVPTLSLDHCGMHDVICDQCGIKIPINSYQQVIDDIAQKIDYYSVNRAELKKMSDGSIICAEKYKWDERVTFFENMYNEAISIHKEKKYHNQ